MLSFSFSQLSFTVVLVLLFFGIQLEARSVIVDDADTSRITYSSTGWNIGNTCTACFAQPDKTQAKDETWHDGTASGTDDLFFTFTFTGTSVELRYIAMDIIETAFTFTTGTNVSYSIDGIQRGTAVRNPANRDAYVYDQSLFKVTGLTNVEHTLRVDLLKPSAILFDYLIYEEEDAVTSPSASTRSSTSSSVSTIPSNSSNANDTSLKSSTNTGAIIGGIVAAVIILVLGAVLIWYFLKRRKRRQIPQRNTTPILESASPPPQYLPPDAQHNARMSMAATAQGNLSSHFYVPSNVMSQGPYNPLKTGQTRGTFVPQQSASGHSGPNASSVTRSASDYPSAASLIGMNLMRAPSISLTASTIPPSSPAMTHASSLPSVPETHGGPRVNEKSSLGMSLYSAQNPTATGAPPSSFYTNVVANRVQTQIPDEPVEEGLMSRRTSMKSIPPPYSPGGVWHDEDAPPLPAR